MEESKTVFAAKRLIGPPRRGVFVDKELELIFSIVMSYEETKREKYKQMLKMMELPEFESKVFGFIDSLGIDYKKTPVKASGRENS